MRTAIAPAMTRRHGPSIRTRPTRETARARRRLSVSQRALDGQRSRHSRFAASSSIAAWRSENLRRGPRGASSQSGSRRAPSDRRRASEPFRQRRVSEEVEIARVRDARRDRARAAAGTSGSAFQSRASRATPWALRSAAPSRRARRGRCTRACTTTSTAKAIEGRDARRRSTRSAGRCGHAPPRGARRRRGSWRAAAATGRRRGAAAASRRPVHCRDPRSVPVGGVMRDASRRCSGASSRA